MEVKEEKRPRRTVYQNAAMVLLNGNRTDWESKERAEQFVTDTLNPGEEAEIFLYYKKIKAIETKAVKFEEI